MRMQANNLFASTLDTIQRKGENMLRKRELFGTAILIITAETTGAAK